MKSKKKIPFIACFLIILLCNVTPAEPQAKTYFVTIGSGDVTGVYFPTGLTIAKMVNEKRNMYGIRATVESTRGSVFNVNALMAGYLEFGLVQSDKQYQAVKGHAEWAKKGPQNELRALFSLHHESVNLIAAIDAGIKKIADLKDKRVNLGNPGSGQNQNSIDALQAVGLNPRTDVYPETVKASEAPRLLQDNRIDAFFCTVGHPSDTLQIATSGDRKVRFIAVTGPGIDRMIDEKHYYATTTVPVRQFYQGSEDLVDVKTFSVIATLCTSTRVPAEVVYIITKEVLDNFEEFKRQHPAYVTLSKESILKGLIAPFHPGAIKYFTEVGMMN